MRIYSAIAALIGASTLHATDLNALQRNALQHYGAKAAWDSAQLEQTQRSLQALQSQAKLVAQSKAGANAQAQKAAQLSWWVQQSAYEKNAQGNKFERNIALAGQDFSEIKASVQAESCAQAPLISEGVFQSRLHAPGAIWIQIDVPVSAALQVSTVGSEMDTQIAVYENCPSGSESPQSRKDDDVGLYAEYMTTPGARLTKRQWLAVSGDAAGRIQTRIKLVGESISGQLSTTNYSGFGWNYLRLYSLQSNYFSFSSFATANSPSYTYTLNFDAVVGARYFLRAGESGSSGPFYLSRLYPNAGCLSLVANSPLCDVASATPLIFSAGQQMTDINIAIDEGANFDGRLIGAGPLRNAKFTVAYVEEGQAIFSQDVNVDETGRYLMGGLMPNLRYALLGRADFYAASMYPNILCSINQGCNLTLAELVYPGRFDIPLVRVPYVKIKILPVGQIYGAVTIYSLNGSPESYFISGNDGVFQFPLAQGLNYVSIHIDGYQPILYGAQSCVSSPGANQFCTNYLQGAPITGIGDPEISVMLAPLPSLSGNIKGGKGQMSVRACGVNFSVSCTTTTVRTDGSYRFNRISAGSYYIEVSGEDVIDTLYPNVPCQISQYSRCRPELTSAEVVSVGLNDVTNIDITATPSGVISGLVNSLYSGNIELVKSGLTSGIYGSYSFVGESAYSIKDLLPGSYRARIAPTSIVFGQVFPGINCDSNCAFNQGAEILVNSDQISANVDFSPARKNVVSGEVRTRGNAPIALMPVDVFRIGSDNILQREGSVVTDGRGRYQYFSQYTEGYTYIVATDSRDYRNMVYQNVLCPLGTSMYLGTCPANGATRLALPATVPGQFENINFQLGTADELFFQGFEAASR